MFRMIKLLQKPLSSTSRSTVNRFSNLFFKPHSVPMAINHIHPVRTVSSDSTSNGAYFVNHKEKKSFIVGKKESLSVRYHYGRGTHVIQIDNGRIYAGFEKSDITCFLPDRIQKSKQFLLSFNSNVKINGYDITNLLIREEALLSQKSLRK